MTRIITKSEREIMFNAVNEKMDCYVLLPTLVCTFDVWRNHDTKKICRRQFEFGFAFLNRFLRFEIRLDDNKS